MFLYERMNWLLDFNTTVGSTPQAISPNLFLPMDYYSVCTALENNKPSVAVFAMYNSDFLYNPKVAYTWTHKHHKISPHYAGGRYEELRARI
ncbi:hypothetical protein AAES_23780 [Amazona aestiva]|uniref:Uncharacterized protein n=1 Tax=Amazona aestiva TaxID=12930 RepID=A0A0Q3X7N4_AMAAE|nr:hypothetical protein AAES_23780 [Amazona aestiva]